MPIILLVAFLFFGLGYWRSWLSPQRCCHRNAVTDRSPPRLVPVKSFEERCRGRIEDARLRLIASEYLRAPDSPSFWAGAAVRTGANPGGSEGVWLTLDGAGHEMYAAGVSAGQAEQKFPEWTSFSRGCSRTSLWRDQHGRSGVVAAFDGQPARRLEFVRIMRPAVDECLAIDE